jgi:hypothetical protein
MLKQINRSLFIVLITVVLAACSFPDGSKTGTSTPGQQIKNPYGPQAGDDALVRGSVEIVKTEMLTLESFPVQFSLKISFFTPTPCHQFRVTLSQPDASKRINVEVYSLMKNGQVCSLMRTQNPTEASLNLGSLPAGQYTVLVNGVKAVEFDS